MEPISSTTPASSGTGSHRPVEAVDRDPANRPGVPQERAPQPWPNSRFPPERMRVAPSVPKHGRPGKPMPPVYGTAVPLHGISGVVRRAAYRYPDHVATHWLLLMLGDRVDAWTARVRRLMPVAIPLLVLGVAARRVVGRRA